MRDISCESLKNKTCHNLKYDDLIFLYRNYIEIDRFHPLNDLDCYCLF